MAPIFEFYSLNRLDQRKKLCPILAINHRLCTLVVRLIVALHNVYIIRHLVIAAPFFMLLKLLYRVEYGQTHKFCGICRELSLHLDHDSLSVTICSDSWHIHSDIKTSLVAPFQVFMWLRSHQDRGFLFTHIFYMMIGKCHQISVVCATSMCGRPGGTSPFASRR